LAAYVLLLAVTCLFPPAVAVIASRRVGSAAPVLLGAACFTVTQLCIRIPLLQHVLPLSARYVVFQSTHPVAYMILLALSAGIAEECGRYLFLRLGRQRRPVQGVAFGIGHGGIEAALLVGVSAASLLFRPAFLHSIAPEMFLASAAERLSAMAAHVGLSLIVLRSQRKDSGWLLPLAVVMHALLDLSAALLLRLGAGFWAAEGAVAGFAACILLLSVYLWKPNAKEATI